MRPTFFILNLTSMIIANKNSQSQIFRTIYIGGQQYVWGYKFVGARKIYFKIYCAVKKLSQLESFLFSIFFNVFNPIFSYSNALTKLRINVAFNLLQNAFLK